MLTASARAAHRDGPPPWILDDTFAAGLAGDDGAAMMDRVRSRVSPDGWMSFVTWVCLRGRFTEDFVDEAIHDGIHQYVILGAGLDSSAYRHAEWVNGTSVFEVDHESSQVWKRSRLDALGIQVPANVVFAPVDFERETLRLGLVRAGFDVNAAAVFSWMGVTMYLTEDAIEATLKELAALAAGSRLILTYNQPFESVDAFSRDLVGAIASSTSEGGEPFLSVFTSKEARTMLSRHGFADIEDVGPQDLKLRYLGERPDLELANAQRVLVGTTIGVEE